MTRVVNLVRAVLSAKFISCCGRNRWCDSRVTHTPKCNEPATIQATIINSWLNNTDCLSVLALLTNQNGRYFYKTHLASLLSNELMSCCLASTNKCLDLKRRAFPLGEPVRAEWNRCPSSMARCNRDSVAPLRRNSASWIPARIGRLSTGLGRKHPVTIRKSSLMADELCD